ncbi:hypothetical protein DV096_19035 [Bradymonadaceae bacterium TMQ3]|nr:hypothetical protein DV096_19035 [Bradymonadaceae bacterium TMQ3]TXC74598.1 hypothetical protein FRC91_15920 [Bradymonadales bacterium TMQ1]
MIATHLRTPVPARTLSLLLIALSSLALSGCLPDPVDDENDTGIENDTGNDSGDEPDVEEDTEPDVDSADDFDPQFVEIAEIVRTTCAVATCHGSSPGDTDLLFGASESNLSYARIAEVFAEYETANGDLLIVPGDAEASYLHTVVTSEDIDVIMPSPPLPPLTGEQITLITDWINGGANYQ